MTVLWDRGPLAARDIYSALSEGHDWAYKTVKTLIARLVVKGAVSYEQIGNSYLYQAVFSREQVTKEEVKGFVDRVLDGSLLPVLMYFIEDKELSDDEAERLRDLLKKRGKSKRSKEG